MKVYYSTAVTLKLKDTEEREFIHSDKIFHLVYYVNNLKFFRYIRE